MKHLTLQRFRHTFDEIKLKIMQLKFLERLYERFKIDVLGTSQGRHTMDVFSGRFEDAPRTFLQNFKNKQQMTFKYWMNRIESNTTVMCFVLCLNLGTSLARHYADATLRRSWTSLKRLSEIYETIEKLNSFYFLVVL